MKPTNQKWEPCSPGLIHEAATESLGRSALLKLLAGCAIIVALVAGTTVGVLLSDAQPEAEPMSQMSCLSVQDQLGDFMDENLPEETSLEILGHLMKCNYCMKAYDQMADCPSRPKRPKFKVCPCTGHSPCP